MAIDTENKRRSVQAYSFGLMRPVADGSVGVADRPTVAWLYSGLSYSPPPPVAAADPSGLKTYNGPHFYLSRGGQHSGRGRFNSPLKGALYA